MKPSNLFFGLGIMSFVGACLGKLVMLNLPVATEARFLASIDASLDAITGILFFLISTVLEENEK